MSTRRYPLPSGAGSRQHAGMDRNRLLGVRACVEKAPETSRRIWLRRLVVSCRWGLLASNTRSLPREQSVWAWSPSMRPQDMEAALREFVSALEPETLTADAAVALVDTFVTLEKLVAAGKALAARRVAESDHWRGAGERSAAHWLARRAGSSVGAAMATLETAARLPELPAVDRAVRAGVLSAVQANEIASAAGSDPGAEAELLAVAQDDGFALRDTCRRVKAAAAPDGMACHRAIHASRSLRHWSDPDVAGRLDGRFTPEVLAELLVALEPFDAEASRVARDEGRREGVDVDLADATPAFAAAALH